ncbi:MAG: hypothetical protein ACJAZO_004545 [Myxococcota bacterium]|jgi:hypothetical protein
MLLTNMKVGNRPMRRATPMLAVILFGCPSPSDTSDTAPSHFNPDSSECECPLGERTGTWPTSADDPFWGNFPCGNAVVCPDDSIAAFGLEHDYIEYADYTFFDASGAILSYRATTDGIESEDPEDCLRAGITTWYGTPVPDCVSWSGGDAFSWPTCISEWPESEPSGDIQQGYLTSLRTWDATEADRQTHCWAETSCTDDAGTPLRALIHIWVQRAADWDEVHGGAVDVFDTATGAIVGTREFRPRLPISEPRAYGTVPLACLTAPPTPTPGCLANAESP